MALGMHPAATRDKLINALRNIIGEAAGSLPLCVMSSSRYILIHCSGQGKVISEQLGLEESDIR